MTDRLVFDPATRRIGIRTGKVELGQHIHETYIQMAARALCAQARHFHVCPVVTDQSPDDGLTVGSLSVQVTGAAIASEASEAAEFLRTRAAHRLNVPESEVDLGPDDLVFRSGTASCDLFDLVSTTMPESVGNVAATKPLVEGAITGQRRFLQDMTLPGMIHARALRGRAASSDLPDGCEKISEGGFVAILAADNATLSAIWEDLPEDKQTGDTACDGPIPDWIKSCTLETKSTGSGGETTHTVRASRPFLLHASIAPSCAVAHLKGGELHVWTHSQGLNPLRDQIARMTSLPTERVIVYHVPSAGAYGHNAADDAAADAAMIAMHRPDTPVRVAWPRVDDMRASPVGAPMLVEASAALDASNTIRQWRQEIWSGPHGQRPGGGGSVNLLAAFERDPAMRPKIVADLPEAVGSGAARNGRPLYNVPDTEVTTHLVQDLSVRSSSLRGLGAQMNTVAIEALMDRLALHVEEPPIDFRARHLDDPRAIAVLDALRAPVAMELPEDEAIGIGIGRYKGKAAYVGVAARVRLEDSPRLLEMWATVDAGHVASRNGALNQIEGGMIQAASWTLCEGVWLRNGQIDAFRWADYPTLTWDAVPELHIELIEAGQDAPPLGVGECMVGPTSAAIVNAISSGLGQTLADLPLNRETLTRALAE